MTGTFDSVSMFAPECLGIHVVTRFLYTAGQDVRIPSESTKYRLTTNVNKRILIYSVTARRVTGSTACVRVVINVYSPWFPMQTALYISF